MDYNDSSYKWNYQGSMRKQIRTDQYPESNTFHRWLRHLDRKFYVMFPYIYLLLSPNLTLVDTTLSLHHPFDTERLWRNLFFPVSGFAPLSSPNDSFIRGGKCHRPWLIGGKHLFAKGRDSLIRQSLMWVGECQRALPSIWICFNEGSALPHDRE